MTLSREELLTHLEEQFEFIRASCEAYDSGRIKEYKRIALHLKTLLHNTKTQTSLLSLLGVRDKLIFVNTSQPFTEDGNHRYTTKMGLVVLQHGDNGIIYIPKVHLNENSPPWSGVRVISMSFVSYDGMSKEEIERISNSPASEVHRDVFEENKNVDFETWWSESLMRGSDGDIITRSFCVLNVANKDGDAHIDETLPEKYKKLSREDTFGWAVMWSDRPDDLTFGSPFPASIRQIGHEILQTIENNRELIYNSR